MVSRYIFVSTSRHKYSCDLLTVELLNGIRNMIARPGTVSKILWHFTGGPVWDDKRNKQGKNLKPLAQAYDALKSIVRTSELRIGGYHEIVKVIIPQKRVLNRKTDKFEIRKNVPVTIKSSPVCCIADIPIQHLSYHSKRYGKIAIGFHRDSVVRKGFNPVLYSLEKSSLSRTVHDGYSAIDDFDPWLAKFYLDDLDEEIQDIFDTNDVDEQVDISNVSEALDDLENSGEVVRDHYKDFLAFIKTFESKEFDSIYCEREWRSTTTFKFSTDDIAMIVLPRNVHGINYFHEFLVDTELPRSIPVICWEDLIEH